MMAEIDFDDFEGNYSGAQASKAGRVVNLIGAACSVCLIIGVAVWGYKLAVRDVSGIPVVRALEGPLRIAPENPGGDVAMHQGLSVNAVAAVGTALPLPEKVALAPREAVLSADDQAGLAVLVPSSVELPAAEAAVAQSDLDLQADPEPLEMSAVLAPVEEPIVAPAPVAVDTEATDIAVSEPIPETQADAVALALAAALADDAPEKVSLEPAAVTVSVRPKSRTAAPAADPSLDPAVAVLPPTAEIDATTIVAGTLLAQLGAFDDELTARAEWARLQAQFPDLVGAKSLVIQPAPSGGRTFYRLRAHGFASEDETRRFCAALLAENGNCIAVAQR